MKGLEPVESLSTNVKGLDPLLEGGWPASSLNLISGTPGSGKTTLAHQLMFGLAEPGRPALYFTALVESPAKMQRFQHPFDFFDTHKLDAAVRYVEIPTDAFAAGRETVLEFVLARIEEHQPAFIFIDSFQSLLLACGVDAGKHPVDFPFAHRCCTTLANSNATTFLVGDFDTGDSEHPLYSMADGILCLRQSVQRTYMVRKLEVVKLRGRQIRPGLHTFRIDRSGISVFAPAEAWVPIAADSIRELAEKRQLLGVPALDEMLGGGLPRGYSLLVAGPSGSGKSTLAAAFLTEGARCGETGLIAAFEQRPHRSRNRVIADLIDNGSVSLVDTRAPDLSIDEIVMTLVSEIRRINASRVVIDSLSGFELALAPTFRQDFRESLSRMVTALAGTGATVLMTSELEDRYTDLRFSPYGTAFLTDAIIVQRYIEVESRLLRVMAVVKLRASAHSDELRLFTIDQRGIVVGETLPHQEGLLGGRPTEKATEPSLGT